jgi:hypothetical protein
MIRLADIEFLRRVAEMSDSKNPHIARKKKLMVQVVLAGRKDLRKGGGSRCQLRDVGKTIAD